MLSLYEEIHPRTWMEALELLNSLDQHMIFRGQSNSAWNLKSSIERCNFFGKNYRVEKDFLRDFQRGAYAQGIALPESRDVLSWLALMQHHGAPTRLVDFTHSPYIASFFALESANSSSAVWAAHELHLMDDLSNKFPEAFDSREDWFYGLPDKSFGVIFENNNLDAIFPVKPTFTNRRLMAQQALFLSLGNSNKSFDEQLGSYSWKQALKEHVKKIVLPLKLRDEALYDLNRMNINRSTLFPDIDGFSHSLKNFYELRYRGAASKIRYRSNNGSGKRR